MPPDYFTTGGVWTDAKRMSDIEARAFCFIEAMHMIIRDKCDPEAVHLAWMTIDEYRDGCADDMPYMMASMRKNIAVDDED